MLSTLKMRFIRKCAKKKLDSLKTAELSEII